MVVDGEITPRQLYPPKRTLLPIGEGWVGPKADLEGFWRRENPLPPPNIEPRIVQAVASRYTDYTVPAP
jgi:hypothetical protein